MSELRPGYQQSDVGVIPKDWSAATIADVGRLQTGPFGTVLKASEYSDDHGVPLISVGEIKLGKIVLRPDTPVVDTRVVRRLPRYLIREGDILFGRKGGVDRSALVSRQQDGWFLGSDGIRLRPSSEYASQFLAFQFQTQRIQHWLLENSVGTTMPSMNEAVLSQLGFPIPSTEQEQKAIVEALADADALIEGLEALISKKRDIKQGAVQDLLSGERRLPGFGGAWVSQLVGRIFDFGRSVPLSRAQLSTENDVRYIHYGDIHTRLHIHLDFQKTSTPGASQGLCASATPLKVGDWVFADASEDYDGVAKAIEITRLPSDRYAVAGLHTILLRERTHTFAPGFKGYLSYAPSFRSQVLRVATGMKVFGISKAQMKAIELHFPPNLDEQRAITTVLSDMGTEIAALEDKLAKARAVKQGMMQVLLTGEIRLI